MPKPIDLLRYEKPLKNGWYSTRTVYRVSETEVLYRFDTEDGYGLGAATPVQFRRWMRGCLPAEAK